MPAKKMQKVAFIDRDGTMIVKCGGDVATEKNYQA
jgi:histidinol phosphatase-like enzyme